MEDGTGPSRTTPVTSVTGTWIRQSGGESGIRTHETGVSRLHDFESCAFDQLGHLSISEYTSGPSRCQCEGAARCDRSVCVAGRQPSIGGTFLCRRSRDKNVAPTRPTIPGHTRAASLRVSRMISGGQLMRRGGKTSPSPRLMRSHRPSIRCRPEAYARPSRDGT